MPIIIHSLPRHYLNCRLSDLLFYWNLGLHRVRRVEVNLNLPIVDNRLVVCLFKFECNILLIKFKVHRRTSPK